MIGEMGVLRLDTITALLCGLLTSCAAEVSNYCVSNPEECPECENDSDCVFTGNPCTDYVYCAHREVEVIVVSIGCSEAQERRWPDDDECRCIGGVCRAED
jgi:hypothetical protein